MRADAALAVLCGLAAPRAPAPRAASQAPDAPEVPRWFVAAPRTIDDASYQAARSALSAVRDGHRRLLLEVGIPEVEPDSDAFRLVDLITFVLQVGTLLRRAGTEVAPAYSPRIKLLFGSGGDAMFAGATIHDENLPVAVLGSGSAIGARDGAFVLVMPGAQQQSAQQAAATENAVRGVLSAAGSRVVIALNPRLGGAGPLASAEPAYVLRPLAVSYVAGGGAYGGGACLLRCFPHEWSVLVKERSDLARREARDGAGAEADAPAGGIGAGWRYAGRFSARPTPVQLERAVRAALEAEPHATEF